MLTIPAVVDVPLKVDKDGTIRVGTTRVTLESVIADHQRGASPESIVEHFPVLNIADVYHVLGYYVNHRADIDEYMRRQREEGERIRREWEAEHPPPPVREELQARLAARHTKRE
ncbi:MAG: DUF433 domain-containing protein [Anaerolineae bacterium]|nr:DUF433 domain-containing protein [Anaerolineae bacterium]